MKINILLPYKEKFDENKASSVSITVRNNLLHSNYLNQIKIFGQYVENPLFKDNFVGLKYTILSFTSKNKFLANEMLKMIVKDPDETHLIEIHNRPYLVHQIKKGNRYSISLFFHNDPKTMRGSKSIKDRENILEKCAAVFCVSEYLKKQYLDNVVCHHEKVHVLYNGVQRSNKNFPKKEKEILFVGRLVVEKGVELYVDVIKSIANKYPDWSFGLIGSSKLGDNKNMNSFASRVREKFYKIGPQAKFYGFKDHNFVEEKMKTASIIIIPSIWEEPFGLVAAEAMSNGIAIIASKVGGIPEIVKDNGILIEDIDFIKLRQALKKLLNNKKIRSEYQKKAWENFELTSSLSSARLDGFRKIILQDQFKVSPNPDIEI